MTVEDPIEFLHRHKKSLVNQREVGADTHSFANALKHVLRQDPDVILVGELRDLETISVALTAAETGHLVFATLHTQDAAQTIDRIIDVFPPTSRARCARSSRPRSRASSARRCARRPNGRGRAVATEVLVATPAIRNLIREGKTHQIYSAMQAGARARHAHAWTSTSPTSCKTGKITYEVGAGEVPPRRGLQQARRPDRAHEPGRVARCDRRAMGYGAPRGTGCADGDHQDVRVRGPRHERQDRQGAHRGPRTRRPSPTGCGPWARARRRSTRSSAAGLQTRDQASRASATGSTLKDLAVMARQMATMISAGLSLLRTLTILAEQTENKTLAKVLGAGPQRRRDRLRRCPSRSAGTRRRLPAAHDQHGPRRRDRRLPRAGARLGRRELRERGQAPRARSSRR